MANHLNREKQIGIITMLVEGTSIRSVERITGVHRDTIMRLMVRVGENCQRIQDEMMRGISSESLQVDEVWSFVHTKQAKLRADDPDDFGDQYTFVAMDQSTKLVPSFMVGKRTHQITRDV